MLASCATLFSAAIARLAATAERIADPASVRTVAKGLDTAQAAAVAQVLESGVSLLTGGPGTGKSRTVAAIVKLLRAKGTDIALAAPTGRAAKRLEELTDHPATTVHRLLGAQGMTGGFARNEEWPLDAEVVVVDEASMLDVELTAALLEACPDGTHLLLVGDPAQLPSIGPGHVLGDLIDSGAVPVTELTTLHRQAAGGAIARLATGVRGGELVQVESPDREVVIVPATGSAEAARRVVQLVTDSIPRALGIEPGAVQVVTPVHRGPAGTIELNKALKAQLNPGQGTVWGFDPGDRVVATARTRSKAASTASPAAPEPAAADVAVHDGVPFGGDVAALRGADQHRTHPRVGAPGGECVAEDRVEPTLPEPVASPGSGLLDQQPAAHPGRGAAQRLLE